MSRDVCDDLIKKVWLSLPAVLEEAMEHANWKASKGDAFVLLPKGTREEIESLLSEFSHVGSNISRQEQLVDKLVIKADRYDQECRKWSAEDQLKMDYEFSEVMRHLHKLEDRLANMNRWATKENNLMKIMDNTLLEADRYDREIRNWSAESEVEMDADLSDAERRSEFMELKRVIHELEERPAADVQCQLIEGENSMKDQCNTNLMVVVVVQKPVLSLFLHVWSLKAVALTWQKVGRIILSLLIKYSHMKHHSGIFL